MGAKKEGVNVIYLSIDSYLDVYMLGNTDLGREKEKAFSERLRKFITLAGEQNIKVDALGGWRNWAEEGHTYKPLAIVNFVKNFNETHDNKFRGFQYDIEPYLLGYYHEDKESKKLVFQNFIKLIDETTYSLKDSDLKFTVVIPDFYDAKDKTVPEFSYNGSSDSALVHLLEILESKPKSALIIMSYRNFAEGKDGSIEVSKHEMNTVKRGRYSTQMILAQETGDFLPAYITFHNTSKSHFLTESTKLSNAFSSFPQFSGLAIHYANAFMALK